MRSLRSEVLEPAPGLIPDVLAALEEAGERHAVRSLMRRHRMAYVGGLRRRHRSGGDRGDHASPPAAVGIAPRSPDERCFPG